ncbi:MAG: hypothetical protein ACSLFN_08995 [Candidatus Limnocylindrales bacterium]
MDQPIIVVTVIRPELAPDVYEFACERLTKDIAASGTLDLTFEVWSAGAVLLASPAVCAEADAPRALIPMRAVTPRAFLSVHKLE